MLTTKEKDELVELFSDGSLLQVSKKILVGNVKGISICSSLTKL
jgi:hypothetical protein